MAARVQVYEFNVPTFGKGVVFDVDHKVGRPCFSTSTCLQALQTCLALLLGAS